MKITKMTNLACPLDGLPLLVDEKQCVCPHGHSFDVARQGYVNLLPVQHKRSKNPGDSTAMIFARTVLLNSGVYAPIADKLNAITHELVAGHPGQELCLLDAGCGEGYYLTQLLASLQQQPIQQDVALIGLDISKPAIHAAAKRSKQITWLIASNKQPPLSPYSVDIIFCLFGFPVYESFKQLLTPAGKIILVEAGPEHLLELRTIIYPTVTKAPPPALAVAETTGFSLCDQSRLTYSSKLNSTTQIMNLLAMTPHYYRASQAGMQAAQQLETMDITVDVVFRVLERGTG
jgi:23S rRNA (guanine745-N1)-methyltransferase